MKKSLFPTRTHITLLAAACLALALPLAFTSCKPDSGGTTVSPGESGVRSVADGDSGSEHFDAVARHLDLGGAMFGYMDVDGDVEKIAGMFQQVLDVAKQQAGGDMPPQFLNVQISDVISEIGIDGIEAVGLSSVKNGELYHNRAYLHIPEGHKGLLRFFGDESQPFLGPQLAPKDSDLLVEYRLNVKAGYDLASNLVTRFGGPEAASEMAAAVSKPMPGAGITLAEVLGKLDTRLTMLGRIHPDKPLQIPDAPVKIPSFDLLIALDDAGWLYERISGAMKQQMPPEEAAGMFVKGDGFERIILPPVPSPEMTIARPVIHHDIANGRVLAASTAAFLDECLAGKSHVADSDDFKAAMEGLPAEGNAMTFVTGRFMSEYRKLITSTMESGPTGAAEAAILSSLLQSVMPDTKSSQASVLAHVPGGTLIASNAVTSWKESSVIGAMAVVSAGASSFILSSRQAQFHAEDARVHAHEREQETIREMRIIEKAAHGEATEIPGNSGQSPRPVESREPPASEPAPEPEID